MEQQRDNLQPISPIKRVFKWVFNVFFGLIFALAATVLIMSFVTRGSNHGVPNYFGYQIMVVESDSMAPTLKVKTAVIVKKVDVSTLVPRSVVDGQVVQEGDIVSYYTSGVVVTHRLVDLKQNVDGSYTLTTKGENVYSNQCDHTGGKLCVYREEEIHEANYMGKVIGTSDLIGWLYSNVLIVLVVLVGLPIVYLLLSILYDAFKNRGEEDEKTDSQEEKQ